MHKSVPKVPNFLTFGKVSQKLPKNQKFSGVGGVTPVLDEVQIKAVFFFRSSLSKFFQSCNSFKIKKKKGKLYFSSYYLVFVSKKLGNLVMVFLDSRVFAMFV